MDLFCILPWGTVRERARRDAKHFSTTVLPTAPRGCRANPGRKASEKLCNATLWLYATNPRTTNHTSRKYSFNSFVVIIKLRTILCLVPELGLEIIRETDHSLRRLTN
ncbi:unnamed protein product [Ectocarpus sp. 8 AP-2014]